jgi:hypothetical protein
LAFPGADDPLLAMHEPTAEPRRAGDPPEAGALRAPGAGGRGLRAAALGVGLVGMALRLWQYGANASLWADEANLALNIVRRPALRLLEPLDYRQVAPPGWLLLEKGAVVALGDGELALRLVPLLGSLLSLPLFWWVAQRVLGPGAPPALALALLALGIPFIHYAAQVKPYATDIALALALLALALVVQARGPRSRPALGLAALGVVAPWLSYPAILVLAGLGAALGGLALRRGARGRLAPLAAIGLAWAVSAVGALAWARGAVTPDDVAYMQRFWAPWFLPWPPRSLVDLGWPIARLTTVYAGGGLRYPVPGIFLVLAGAGLWALWRRARPAWWLLVAPILTTFAAAAGRSYPFAPRVVLFLFPAFLLLTAAGVHALATAPIARARRVAALVGLGVLGLAAWGVVRNPPPYAPEPLKPVLAGLRAAWQPGDRLYVYYGAEKAFVYYAERYGFEAGSYVLGRCTRDDQRAYLRELDAFRGAPRLWILITHAAPELEEDTAVLGYLDRVARRRATIRHGGREGRRGTDVARADLYDLSDPARLAAATADDFPLPPRPRTGRADAWSCHPGA